MVVSYEEYITLFHHVQCTHFEYNIHCIIHDVHTISIIISVMFICFSIQKLLTSLMPTDDERTMIAEAKAAKPDIPLEPAEDFLYTLSSIPELKARLSLLRFNYVFQQVEEVRVSRREGGSERERERRRETEGDGGSERWREGRERRRERKS